MIKKYLHNFHFKPFLVIEIENLLNLLSNKYYYKKKHLDFIHQNFFLLYFFIIKYFFRVLFLNNLNLL